MAQNNRALGGCKTLCESKQGAGAVQIRFDVRLSVASAIGCMRKAAAARSRPCAAGRAGVPTAADYLLVGNTPSIGLHTLAAPALHLHLLAHWGGYFGHIMDTMKFS
jgi:hypothetical protein